MLIAVPVDDKSMKSKVCVSFGRAPYFLIYDTDSGSTDFITNPAAMSQGGAGIKAAQTVVDSQAKVLLTPRCGENAAQVVAAAGIKMFKTVNDSIQDNIDAYKGSGLSPLEDFHPGFHGQGGQ
ncbi:MAG TPA: NifB/NifX family molybdenum-iron cluster-binding protein [Syntrophomonadaceae bacterium]|nr:NifB/NifX family molybdenum-iron cluster-binding protein [Syntrophomonadaceae bacterium]